MLNHTRQTLIQRLQQAPDERSWEEFSETYSSYISAILRGMRLSHHDVEDLKQQILLKVWKGLPNFKYEPHKHRFRGWLCTVARNTARSWLTRGKAAHNSLPLPDGDKPDPETSELDKLFEAEWENYLIERAMTFIAERFHEKVMQTFQLFLDGKSATEVADLMGMTVNAAYVSRKRVETALTKEIIRLDKEYG